MGNQGFLFFGQDFFEIPSSCDQEKVIEIDLSFTSSTQTSKQQCNTIK
jgi:hypothetical protein